MKSKPVLATAALLLFSGCFWGTESDPDDPWPEIVELTASAESIDQGQRVTLRWRTRDAVRVELTDGAGTPVDVSTLDPAEGSIEVSPEATTTYRLDAVGKSRTVDAGVTVEVRPAQVPEVLAFTSSETAVYRGETVTLSWQTRGAIELSLLDDLGTSLPLPGDSLAAGSLEVTVTRSTSWTLTARSLLGEVGATTAVAVSEPPAIVRFAASPAGAIDPGATVMLDWQVTGADSIEIVDGAGTRLHSSNALTGAIEVAPTATTLYTLWAYAALGGVPAVVEVPVRPSIGSFEVTPSTAPAGTSVTWSWTTRGATSLDLRGPGDIAYVVPAGDIESGSYSATVETGGQFTLRADGGSGLSATRTVQLVVPVPTVESFLASPPTVSPGGSTTLVWTSRGGTTLEVLDGTGAPVCSTSDLGAVASGSCSVTVATASTFTLVVSDGIGRTADATVSVDTSTGARITRFTASASTLTLGESATLSWAVTDDSLGNAPSLALTDDLGASYDLTGYGQVTSGYPITPSTAGQRTYTLGATTPGNPPTTASVTVEAVPAPRILGFSASPAVLDPFTTTSRLSWTTRDVSQLDLWQLDASGNPGPSPIYVVPVVSIGSGGRDVQPTETTRYRLRAENAAGATVTAEVVVSFGVSVGSFTTSATQVPLGGSVVLDWTTSGATSVELTPGPGTVAPSGSRTEYPTATTTYTLCAYAAADSDCQVRTVVVVRPGDVKITEVMANPAAVLDADGEWFEIYNTASYTIDLGGWVLYDNNSSYTVTASSWTIQPGTHQVFGRSADMVTNGGAPVDYSYGTWLNLVNTAGAIELEYDGLFVDSVLWDSAAGWPLAEGASFALLPAAYSGDDTSNDFASDWCLSAATFGDGDRGSPGSQGTSCAPTSSYYTVDPTSSTTFVDISTTGALLAGVAADDDHAQVPGGLGFALPFFGDTVSDIWVSANGFLSFAALTSGHYSNQEIPFAGSADGGLVAAFWDDLDVNPGSAVHYQTTGAAGSRRFIVQWTDFKRFSADGSLTFQVQLFETGDIAVLIESTTSGTGFDGSSATLGIEAVGGLEGVQHSYNSPVLGTGTSVRFIRQ